MAPSSHVYDFDFMSHAERPNVPVDDDDRRIYYPQDIGGRGIFCTQDWGVSMPDYGVKRPFSLFDADDDEELPEALTKGAEEDDGKANSKNSVSKPLLLTVPKRTRSHVTKVRQFKPFKHRSLLKAVERYKAMKRDEEEERGLKMRNTLVEFCLNFNPAMKKHALEDVVGSMPSDAVEEFGKLHDEMKAKEEDELGQLYKEVKKKEIEVDLMAANLLKKVLEFVRDAADQ